jgi:hypothetical protein
MVEETPVIPFKTDASFAFKKKENALPKFENIVEETPVIPFKNDVEFAGKKIKGRCVHVLIFLTISVMKFLC